MDARKALAGKHNDVPPLRPEEKVLVRSYISAGIYWKGCAIAVLAIVVLILAPPLGFFFLLVAAVMLLFEYLVRHNLLLIVTNQRVFLRFGILLVDTIQLRIDRIESVEFQTTPPGQIFGYSSVIISGIGSRLAMIPYVGNPVAIQSAINDLLQNRDTTSEERMREQAQIQAEAIADAIHDNEKK